MSMRLWRGVAVSLLALGTGLPARAVTSTWNNTTGDWFDAAKWSAGVPVAGVDAVIGGGNVLLTNETEVLSSLTVSGGTLVFSNWTTRVQATNVTLTGGTVTLPPAFTNGMMSNRVWIVCTNLTMGTSGKIVVDGLGWAGGKGTYTTEAGFGPGAGLARKAAAGYGGFGGRQEASGTGGSRPYGVVAAPEDPGSGGGSYPGASYYGAPGGGAVRIEATGDVVINGTITANGSSTVNAGGAGSGGGIYITCRTISGAGVVRANGVYATGGGVNTSSGGGRIAVDYNPAEQALIPVPALVFSAATSLSGAQGDIGTLYFSDARLLQRAPLTGLTGQWQSASADLAFGGLTVSNAWLRLTKDSIKVTVTNELLLTTGGRLEIGGNSAYPDVWWDQRSGSGFEALARPVSEMTANPELTCGSLMATNGGALWVFAGITNETVQTGALVRVSGAVSIATSSWLYPVSHATNGGSVTLQVGGLGIAAGGGVNADGLGFACKPNYSTAGAYGPGGGYGYISPSGVGGGHGGKGGNAQSTYGQTYGSSNVAPFHAGSGGGGYVGAGSYRGGSGGGLVRIEAPGADLTIDGTISANGGPCGMLSAAGSGGGIEIVCRGLAGAGVTRAAGGTCSAVNQNGTGGGGRVFVSRRPSRDTFTGSGIYSAAAGVGGKTTGTVGTIWMAADPFAPYITNEAPAYVDADGAGMVGYLASTGGSPTRVYCYWGTNDAGIVKANWTTNDDLGYRDIGYHTNEVINLQNVTKYYYRFYATNDSGDEWSPFTTNFTTAGGFIVNNDGGATALTPTSAVLRGEVVANPDPAVYICWGGSDVLSDDTSLWDHVESVGTLQGSFQREVTGLQANKTYYYRCYAKRDLDDAWALSSTNFVTSSPDLSLADAAVTEGGPGDTPVLSFNVTLSAASAVPVSVDFGTSNGTAVAGSDFAATNGTLTIPAGLTSTSIVVEIIGDASDEFPYETVYLVLSNPVNVVIANSTALGTIDDDDDEAGPKTWNGTGDWTTHANWTPFGQPSPSDFVTIQSGTVLLSSPETVGGLTVSNSAMLTFTNWSTKLTVTGDATIRSNGTITLPTAFTNGMMSNRVWIVCTNLTVSAGGSIDVDGRGWAGGKGTYTTEAGFGPGAGLARKAAAGYGGFGGRQEASGTGGSRPYGVVAAPEDPGSGGGSYPGASYYGAPGGGAVRIEAAGDVVVDGTITANGSGTVNAGGAGSGGGVYITCRTISGAGVVRANGAFASGGGVSVSSGGGRIAVIYNPGQQSLISVPALVFSAATSLSGAPGDIGTLYFPDERLLQRVPLTGLTGQWHSASADLAFDGLTVSNAWLRFVKDSIRLTVTNELLLTAGGRLEIGGNTAYPDVWWDLRSEYHDALARPVSEMTANPELSCGTLTAAEGGSLWVFAGPTNETVQMGALVRVTERLSIATNSWLYPVSHATNGGSVTLQVGGLGIAAGGGINADGLGFACKPNYSTAGAYGPGGGYGYLSPSGVGGGYGGKGGNAQSTYGQTYGSSNVAPFHAGSGGGGYVGAGTYRGGSGGGLVRIEASGADLTIDGTISANGGPCGMLAAAGSGGGVHIVCRVLAGAGLIRAEGGSCSVANQNGSGGGGRIAIFRRADRDTFTGMGSYSVLAGTNGVTVGEVGTLYLDHIRGAGGSLFILR